MNSEYIRSLEKILDYIERSKFRGYDPYDTLNSFIPFSLLGKWTSVAAIQFQKRNPVNIRPLLGVKKGHNPKGMGLMLKAYSRLYEFTGEYRYIEKAKYLFDWLNNNYSEGYSGKCWGYNFDWANKENYLVANTPSVVVTSFVIDGVYQYYLVTNDTGAKELLNSSSKYIISDIPVTITEKGISFSYTHLSKGCCYNASLLAAEILAKTDLINMTSLYQDLIDQAVSFVLSKQKSDGSWNYSYNPEKNTERKQIDFHQGFILISLLNLKESSRLKSEIDQAILKGLHFYRKQFMDNGQALWRFPEKWPVDIHNLSQGIITFSKLRYYCREYDKFAFIIANWTIKNMQSPTGYFYYRKTPILTNRISYLRWSQAWMLLALTELLDING